jgi:[CysO sulfur-carrier protein]-S-L-cysteine hydrolase
MTQHALTSNPRECCGLLSGDGRLISDIYPLRNEADQPHTRYFASPEDLLAAMRGIRESGRTLMGIYHSHPRKAAYPSPSDVEMAFYPEAYYFIISLEPSIDVRAFTIDRRGIGDVAYQVADAWPADELCLGIAE